MANTQINIANNGTTTLLTAGKYCDRNIDVVVDVPASGIMPTGTISITKNGTHDVTNYASANVNVPTATATQFTNLLTQTDTVITFNTRIGSSAGATSTSNGAVLVEVTLPHFVYVWDTNYDVFRFRGLTPLNGNVDVSEDGGLTWTRKYLSSPNNFVPDEYGDAIYRVAHPTDSSGVDNLKIRFTLTYGGIVNTGITAVDLSRCFMTQSEPIGNGGYVATT